MEFVATQEIGSLVCESFGIDVKVTAVAKINLEFDHESLVRAYVEVIPNKTQLVRLGEVLAALAKETEE